MTAFKRIQFHGVVLEMVLLRLSALLSLHHELIAGVLIADHATYLLYGHQ